MERAAALRVDFIAECEEKRKQFNAQAWVPLTRTPYMHTHALHLLCRACSGVGVYIRVVAHHSKGALRRSPSKRVSTGNSTSNCYRIGAVMCACKVSVCQREPSCGPFLFYTRVFPRTPRPERERQAVWLVLSALVLRMRTFRDRFEKIQEGNKAVHWNVARGRFL